MNVLSTPVSVKPIPQGSSWILGLPVSLWVWGTCCSTCAVSTAAGLCHSWFMGNQLAETFYTSFYCFFPPSSVEQCLRSFTFFTFRLALHSRPHLVCDSNCVCCTFCVCLRYFPRDDVTLSIHLQLYTKLGRYCMCFSGWQDSSWCQKASVTPSSILIMFLCN